MVEVFSDRIEFSNAGAPLIAIERIVDTVPISRNENIAGFMRKCGICEERGSGYDKIVAATSQNEMLAPRIENCKIPQIADKLNLTLSKNPNVFPPYRLY